jgi:hypothetical protein
MTNPKLALIPSGYKTATVYSILPNNGGGDFTYERNGSATRVRKDGLIEEVGNDVPRLDYLGGGCPSLLLEPQRTNIQAYSENFSGVAWTPAWSTITANSSISPNGELTAYKLETDETIVPSGGFLAGFLQITANTEYTYSLFVKPDTTSICKIDLYDTVSSSRYFYGTVIFDMATETISTSLATASFDKLDGGWYRLKMTATSPNPLQGGGTGVSISLTQAGSIFIWGAQMEAGSYATSYIKNVDDANGVTRLKDECFNGGDADLFDITEGTFFVDANNFGTPYLGYNMITLSDGSSNLVRFIYESSRIRTSVENGSSQQDYFITGVNDNERNKVAITFKENEFKVYHNGVLKDTDTSGDIPTGLDKLNFASQSGTSRHFEGKVYDTRVYDRVLTQAEAITLTTI